MAIKISVVIPFFNRVQYMAQLIESIPARDDIEVLIIDDKSDSEQTKVLKEYIATQQSVRNIYYFYNDGVKSAGACRNIGLKHAAGEWLLFADADDYFLPNLYELLEPWFEQSYDLIYFIPTSIDRLTGLVTERHEGCERVVRNYRENPCEETFCKLKVFFTVPWSKLIRRSLVEEHRIYFDEILAANDVMFSTKVAFVSDRIATSEDKIYCVTKSPGSIVYSMQRPMLEARLVGFVSHYKYVKAKLPKVIFKKLSLNGRSLIIQFVVQKQPIATVLQVMFTMIKNGIPLFELRLLNPFVIWKAAKGHRLEYVKNKKYYTKSK